MWVKKIKLVTDDGKTRTTGNRYDSLYLYISHCDFRSRKTTINNM